MPRIVSLNTGIPKPMLSRINGEPFTSAIARRPVERPVKVAKAGLNGDESYYQGHGGREMAINVFTLREYSEVEEWAGCKLAIPSFGENLTIDDEGDEEPRVGDVLAGKDCLLQISQPREPCGTLVRFLGLPGIVKAMNARLISGYYLRVLDEGTIEPGEKLSLQQRGPAEWSIHRLNEVMFRDLENEELVHRLQEVEVLSPNWKRSLLKQHEWRKSRHEKRAAKE